MCWCDTACWCWNDWADRRRDTVRECSLIFLPPWIIPCVNMIDYTIIHSADTRHAGLPCHRAIITYIACSSPPASATIIENQLESLRGTAHFDNHPRKAGEFGSIIPRVGNSATSIEISFQLIPQMKILVRDYAGLKQLIGSQFPYT